MQSVTSVPTSQPAPAPSRLPPASAWFVIGAHEWATDGHLTVRRDGPMPLRPRDWVTDDNAVVSAVTYLVSRRRMSATLTWRVYLDAHLGGRVIYRRATGGCVSIQRDDELAVAGAHALSCSLDLRVRSERGPDLVEAWREGELVALVACRPMRLDAVEVAA